MERRTPHPGRVLVTALLPAAATLVTATALVVVFDLNPQLSPAGILVAVAGTCVSLPLAAMTLITAVVCLSYLIHLLVETRLRAGSRALRGLVIVVAIALCVPAAAAPFRVRTLVLGEAPFGCYLRKFDAAVWRKPPRWSVRWEMIGDLLDAVIPGKDRQELANLLGTRPGDPPEVLGYLVFDVATRETDLLLRFDTAGRFVSWSIE